MKKILLGAAALAMTFVGSVASAQGYGGYSGRDGGTYSRSYDRDWRGDRHDRYDRGGRYDGYRGNGGWRQGQVYPYYRQRAYVISDYRAYNLGPPRHGYRYYRSDNGDVVMAAIASGVIGAIIGGALSDNDRHDRGYDNRGYYGR